MSPERGFTPPYEISYRGVKLPKVSAALGCFDLRRGADLPLVGYPASEKGKHRRTSPNAEVQLGIRVAVCALALAREGRSARLLRVSVAALTGG